MVKLKAKGSYFSYIGGPWAKGQTREVEESMAEYLQRDSPGTFVVVKVKGKAKEVAAPPVDKAVKGPKKST